MATTNPATALAATTSDAYSFKYYGASSWQAAALMLLKRGYNLVEVDAILRSKLTRIAADNRKGSRATSADLSRLLDTLTDLQDVVDEYVLGVQTEDDAPVTPAPSGLRLVWSRS